MYYTHDCKYVQIHCSGQPYLRSTEVYTQHLRGLSNSTGTLLTLACRGVCMFVYVCVCYVGTQVLLILSIRQAAHGVDYFTFILSCVTVCHCVSLCYSYINCVTTLHLY